MKKILAVVLALVLCHGAVRRGFRGRTSTRSAFSRLPCTHGWVAGVAYNAEQECLALADEVDYKLYTSNNAEEMTTTGRPMTWGAQAIVAFPQWEGMEVPIQNAIDSGITVVNFDIVIDADGVYRVTGDNEGMGVESAKYIVDKIGTTGTVVALRFRPAAAFPSCA